LTDDSERPGEPDDGLTPSTGALGRVLEAGE
jgi:hypothetical protein